MPIIDKVRELGEEIIKGVEETGIKEKAKCATMLITEVVEESVKEIETRFEENMNKIELEKKMIAADLYLDEGYVFGQEGEGFERINIACPTWVLKEALERLKNAFSGPQVSK